MDAAQRRYLGDYRNFTGITTDRQPRTHTLDMSVDVDNNGVIRTRRVAFAEGPDRYQEYRYYTADQAEKIAHALLEAVRRSRTCAPSRNWTRMGCIRSEG